MPAAMTSASSSRLSNRRLNRRFIKTSLRMLRSCGVENGPCPMTALNSQSACARINAFFTSLCSLKSLYASLLSIAHVSPIFVNLLVHASALSWYF